VHSDDDDGCMSSHSSEYDNSADLMAAAMGDEVTAQLAAAGWPKQHSLGDFTLFVFIFFIFFF
jgi:nuclear respiratory factor 1